jgi:hypothetical protein
MRIGSKAPCTNARKASSGTVHAPRIAADAASTDRKDAGLSLPKAASRTLNADPTTIAPEARDHTFRCSRGSRDQLANTMVVRTPEVGGPNREG